MNATKQVRCGNHGRDKVYHNTVADVRDCYAGRFEDNGAAAAEQAYERHLENAGWEEAQAQEAYERANGVVDFQTAWEQAEREMNAAVAEADRAEEERVASHKLARDGFNEFGQQLDSTWSRADRERAQACTGLPPASAVTQDGMYRNPATGEIFKVQVAVHGSGRLYAKRLVKLDVPKLKHGKEHSYDFEYFPGGLKTIDASWRMTLAEAQEYGVLYGCCIRCGRTLTAEVSIERAMGPVCANKKNWA